MMAIWAEGQSWEKNIMSWTRRGWVQQWPKTKKKWLPWQRDTCHRVDYIRGSRKWYHDPKWRKDGTVTGRRKSPKSARQLADKYPVVSSAVICPDWTNISSVFIRKTKDEKERRRMRHAGAEMTEMSGKQGDRYKGKKRCWEKTVLGHKKQENEAEMRRYEEKGVNRCWHEENWWRKEWVRGRKVVEVRKWWENKSNSKEKKKKKRKKKDGRKEKEGRVGKW